MGLRSAGTVLQGDEMRPEKLDGRMCFSRQLCADWEARGVQAERFGVRVCGCHRSRVGTEGGMLANMLRVRIRSRR